MIACADPLRAAVLVVVNLLRTRIGAQTVFGAVAVALAVTISPTMASAAVNGDFNCTNMASAVPSLPDYLKKARPLNPSYSDEQITSVWTRTYQSNCMFWLEGRIGPDDVAIFKRSLV